MTSSQSPSYVSLPQALTPLTPASNSSLSSSSSVISRQSSCRSTTSVQAVPFRTPIRGSAAASSAGMSRQNSGGASRALDYVGGGSYFAGAPMLRRPSGGAGTQFLSPVMAASATGASSTNGSSLGLHPPIMETGLTNWSAVGAGVEPNVEERPSLEQTSSRLSDGPPTRPILGRQGSAGDVVLRKTVGDFKFGEILGEGSYSTVTMVTDKLPPHKSYALKVLDKEHIKREKKTKYVLIERDTLKTLDGHPGIVRLYWTFQDARSLYYVLELAKNGELLKWIKKFGSFSLPSARFYAAQILSAVEHIHSKGVIHRDLKPENILLDDKMRIKVTDFGTAKLLEDTVSTESSQAPSKPRTRSFVGTPEYVSPEILSEGKESSKSSDYWGFGCILFQILAGRPPFQARTEYLMFQKIIKLEYEFPEGFPEDAKDLVKKLLVLDPLERLGGGEDGIAAIKAHPFFTACDPPIDFDTIWTVEPPPIETGITEPKEEQLGEFVMPEGLDTFDDRASDDDGEFGHEDAGEDGDSSERDEGVRREPPLLVGSIRNGVNGYGHQKTPSTIVPPAEPVTKWTGILLPRETILFASPILDRTGFLSKRRTLILTDYPRLICIKEAPTKVTVKAEIFLGSAQTSSKPSASVFVKAEVEGDKSFWVKTTQRTLKFTEASGSAARWVSELNEAHAQGKSGKIE